MGKNRSTIYWKPSQMRLIENYQKEFGGNWSQAVNGLIHYQFQSLKNHQQLNKILTKELHAMHEEQDRLGLDLETPMEVHQYTGTPPEAPAKKPRKKSAASLAKASQREAMAKTRPSGSGAGGSKWFGYEK